MTTTITMIQPCPPHAWAHAPTVGYFHCHKCNQRIEHNDPRYAVMLAEWGTAAALKALKDAGHG